jgi:hypothetical protein
MELNKIQSIQCIGNATKPITLHKTTKTKLQLRSYLIEK